MRTSLPIPAGSAVRPLLVRLAACGVLVALCVGPVLSALDASAEIDAARQRLDRARAMAARPTSPLPLVAADGEALLTAFRSRLDTLAATQAVVIDTTSLEADPARPDLPRLRATVRGTAGGLHTVMHTLETGTPLMAIEEADLGIGRPADEDVGRPTVMQLAVTLRGVVAGPAPEPGKAPERRTP